MSQKDRVVRKIDVKPQKKVRTSGQIISGGGSSDSIDASVPTLPVSQTPEPENITLDSQTLLRTTHVAKVLVSVSWDHPANITPDLYAVEVAQDEDFTTKVQVFYTFEPRAALELNTGTEYWLRVQAVVDGVFGDSGYLDSFTTVEDTTIPTNVDTVSATWLDSGDILFTWNNPTDSNFFDTRIRIYDTMGGTLYKEAFVVGSPDGKSEYLFTVAENNEVTDNDPLTTIYYIIVARTLQHITSSTSATGTLTKAVPSTPTGLTTSWDSEDGTASEDVSFSWDRSENVKEYVLTLDGIEYITYAPTFDYIHARNVYDHNPTLPSGDPSLAYALRSKDYLGQLSPAVTGLTINHAPSISNLAIQVAAGFASIYTSLTNTKDIQDAHSYIWTLVSGSTALQTWMGKSPETSIPATSGTYTIKAKVVDFFGQQSSEITSSAVIVDSSFSGGSGGGSSLTIQEVDGSPSVVATKLILPNGTVSLAGTEATYTPVSVSGLTYDQVVTQMQLVASSGITKDGSDLVSQWDGVDVYSSYVKQASGSLQPLWVASSINSQPVVRFDGSNDYMSTGLSAVAFPRVMVTLVIKPLATGSSLGIFSWANALTSGTPFVLFQRDSTNVRIYVGGNYQWTIAHANSAAKLYVLEGDGSEWRLWVDGTAQTPASAGMTNQSTATAIFLGNGFNGYSNSEIAYLQIRNGFMPSGDRTTFMNALKTTYGL